MGSVSQCIVHWTLLMLIHICRTVSSFILNTEIKGHASNNLRTEPVFWTIERMKAYIAHCKAIQPSLTPVVEKILGKYYQRQRRVDQSNTARTTIRLLESLIRLTQAHARFMCRTEVTIQDACMAVYLMESSLLGTGLLELTVAKSLHSSFPEEPDAVFHEIRKLSSWK